jgi:Pin2-interacting protein X1
MAADKSAFGYRMMEKMGWAAGKGLGKKEDGMVAHVKVKKRADAQG